MRLFLRNAAIGAAALSYRALFYRDYEVFALLLGLGAVSGVLYTLLEPVFRNHPRLHYLPWILCAYWVLGGGLAVGMLKHDEMSFAILNSPAGVGLLLIVGAIGGYAAARALEDKTALYGSGPLGPLTRVIAAVLGAMLLVVGAALVVAGAFMLPRSVVYISFGVAGCVLGLLFAWGSWTGWSPGRPE
jgi:hypothetical protein